MPDELSVKAKLRLAIEGDQIVIKGLDGVDNKIQQLDKTAKTGGASVGNIFKELLPLITAGTIIKFFVDCVKAAEQEETALRKLRGAIIGQGQSWEEAEEQITSFAKAQQILTRFGDTETYQVIADLTLKLGDYKQALLVTQYAMDVAVKYEKNLTDVTNSFATALVSPQRGMMLLRREFGAGIGDAKNVADAIENLGRSAQSAAIKEENLTKQAKQLKNTWSEFSESVGRSFTNIASGILSGLSFFVKGLHGLLETAKSGFASILTIGEGTWNTLVKIFTLKWGEIPDVWKDVTDRLKIIDDDYFKKVEELYKKLGIEIKKIGGEVKSPLGDPKEIAEQQKKIKELRDKFDLDYLESVKGKYFKELQIIDDKYNEYKNAGVDEVKLAEWRDAEIIRSGDEARRATYQLALDEEKKLREIAEREVAFRKQVMDISVGFASSAAQAIGLAIGESARGGQDAWARAWDSIVDAAFGAIQQILAIHLAAAIADPLLWPTIPGIILAQAGVAVLKGAIRATPTPTPTPVTIAKPTPPTVITPGTYGNVPALQEGGRIERTGIALVHKGEEVIPEGKSGGNTFVIQIMDLSYLNKLTAETFANKISRWQKSNKLIGGI